MRRHNAVSLAHPMVVASHKHPRRLHRVGCMHCVTAQGVPTALVPATPQQANSITTCAECASKEEKS
jgi:hypothetical protein